MLPSLLRRERFKDLAIYVAVSALIIGLVLTILIAGVSWEFFSKWFGLAIFTALVFGQFIGNSRPLWGKRSFWLYIALGIAAHCMMWTIIISRTEHWKITKLYPSIFELVVLMVIRDQLFEQTDEK